MKGEGSESSSSEDGDDYLIQPLLEKDRLEIFKGNKNRGTDTRGYRVFISVFRFLQSGKKCIQISGSGWIVEG